MGKIAKINFLVLSVLFVSTVPVSAGQRWSQVRSILFKVARFTAASTASLLGAGSYKIYRYRLDCDALNSVQMGQEHEKVTRAYIERICPDFRVSKIIRNRLENAYTIKLAELRPNADLWPGLEHAAGLKTFYTNKILLKPHLMIGSEHDRFTGEYRLAVAHELAHYLNHNVFTPLEKREIEADFEGLKMIEKADPDCLDLILSAKYELYRFFGGGGRPLEYLTAIETLFLWSWYKQEREKPGFNSHQFLDLYVQDRELIQNELNEKDFLDDFEKECPSKKYTEFSSLASYVEMIAERKDCFDKHLAKDTRIVVEAYKKIKQENEQSLKNLLEE